MTTDQKSHVASERAMAAPAVSSAARGPLAPQQSELAAVWLFDGVSLESVFSMLLHVAKSSGRNGVAS